MVGVREVDLLLTGGTVLMVEEIGALDLGEEEAGKLRLHFDGPVELPG
jgi:hypothetical protein